MSRLSVLLVLIFIWFCFLKIESAPSPKHATGAKTSTLVNEECEKRVPSSFSAAQKKQLCTFDVADKSSGTIGPAICASVAKQALGGNVKFETILQLCQGASSASPAQCYDKLEPVGNQLRTKYGIDLCAKTNTTLPGECFAELNGFSGTANRLKPEQTLEFCKSLEDRAPLLCLQAVHETKILTVPQAFEICQEVVGDGEDTSSSHNLAVATCLREMQPQIKPSFGVTAMDVLKFCAESNPNEFVDATSESDEMESSLIGISPPAKCFVESAHIKAVATSEGAVSEHSATASLLSPKQRLSLCSNAHTALGPINCTISAMFRGPGKPGVAGTNTGLKPAEVVELCQGALNAGPAMCFVESRNLGTNAERSHLCNGANSAGPAQCYRRSASTFRNDVGNRSLLCISATSEDPALCANSAPHYLSLSEKVDLCSNTPSSHAQDAVRCLTAVEAASKQFRNAPKKALGYFLDSLWDARDRKSRELLLHMCSFSGSQDPIASAECFRAAPNALEHDDAARMCTDIPSTEVIQHMQLCHRILPKDWGSEEASILCESTTSREQVEAALRCAVEASTRMTFPKLTKLHAAQLCALETAKGPVINCLKEINRGVSASSNSAYLLTPETIVQVCSLAGSESAGTSKSHSPHATHLHTVVTNTNPGACLVKLATYSASKLIFDSTVPHIICAHAEYSSILTCLNGANKRMISVDDVNKCVHTKQEIKTIRVKKILTEDNGIEIMAGKRFSLHFELLDQYGRAFLDPNQEYLFSAALNNNNPQGAVLWGIRSNYTNSKIPGLLELNSLVISQSGEVDFKIFINTRAGVSGNNINHKKKDSVTGPKLIDLFRLHVLEDPIVSSALPCIYLLQQTMCPIDSNSVYEWESEFPRIRSYSSSSNYLRNILCAEAMTGMHVNSYVNVQGDLWTEYRLGVDSLWTGVGMPRLEMSPMERLGLSTNAEGLIVSDHPDNDKKPLPAKEKKSTKEKTSGNTRKRERAMQKEIRRAYYRKSLQWHPDRWAGMGMYALPVQAAFELINEAYNSLTNEDKENNTDKKSSANNSSGATEDAMFE